MTVDIFNKLFSLSPRKADPVKLKTLMKFSNKKMFCSTRALARSKQVAGLHSAELITLSSVLTLL